MNERIDMPTNEGTLALARCVATGAKLAIRGAVPCNGAKALLDDDVYKVALATWGESESGTGTIDISDTAVEGYTDTGIPCTSYLPVLVGENATDTTKPMAALDIEFTWMPSSNDSGLTYDAIAVLADMYYEFSSFYMGRPYSVGDTVWSMADSSVVSYYRCVKAIDSSTTFPANDCDGNDRHWEDVTALVSDPTDKIVTPKGVQYRAIGDRPVLLYVSIVSSPITVSSDIEIDYKVRLYLDNVTEQDISTRYIVFDTLGPEFMGSAQLDLLASFAQQLRYIRDVAMEKVNRG